MPYIPESQRQDALLQPTTAGELTYLLYTTVRSFLGDSPRFADFAAVLGALEATKLELYRQVIAPYEDQKRRENGDV